MTCSCVLNHVVVVKKAWAVIVNVPQVVNVVVIATVVVEIVIVDQSLWMAA